MLFLNKINLFAIQVGVVSSFDEYFHQIKPNLVTRIHPIQSCFHPRVRQSLEIGIAKNPYKSNLFIKSQIRGEEIFFGQIMPGYKKSTLDYRIHTSET